MNKEEARQHALGYAAGREDASGIKTAEPTTLPGFMAFADVFGQAWDDYNNQHRFMMTNARDAYDTWQATNGQTIFRRY